MLRSVGSLLFILGLGYTLELPSYIIRCKEEELETCGPDAANAVLSQILHGDSRYGIPSFLPFKLEDIQIDEPQINFMLTKCQLAGLESAHVFKVEWKTPVLRFGINVRKLSIIGQFPSGSNLYTATLPRPGVANFTLNNVGVNIDLLIKEEKMTNGRTHLEPYKIFIELDPESTYFSFSEFSTGVPYVAIKDSETVTNKILFKFKSVLQEVILQSAARIISLFPKEVLLIRKYY